MLSLLIALNTLTRLTTLDHDWYGWSDNYHKLITTKCMHLSAAQLLFKSIGQVMNVYQCRGFLLFYMACHCWHNTDSCTTNETTFPCYPAAASFLTLTKILSLPTLIPLDIFPFCTRPSAQKMAREWLYELTVLHVVQNSSVGPCSLSNN